MRDITPTDAWGDINMWMRLGCYIRRGLDADDTFDDEAMSLANLQLLCDADGEASEQSGMQLCAI